MASRIQQVAAAITAIGSVTPWIKHSYFQSPFNVQLSVFFDLTLAATLAVQFVADDQSQTSERLVQVVQSASTTATITDNGPYTLNGGPANPANTAFGHGLLSNDVVFLTGTQAGVDSSLQGYPVTVVNANQYTVVTPVNQTINVQARATTARVLTHPTLNGLTARASQPYAGPVWMSRLICTAFTTGGKAYLVATQGDNP